MDNISKIKEILEHANSKSYSKLLKKHEDLYKWVIAQTGEYYPKSFNERLYILLVSPPEKTPCGKFPVFNTFNNGYKQFCGPRNKCECSRKQHSNKMSTHYSNMTDDEKLLNHKRKQQGMIRKYGVNNAMKCPEIVDKITQLNMEKYGVASAIERHDVKEKIEKTNIERYGVTLPLCSAEIRQKAFDSLTKRFSDKSDVMQHARECFLNANNGKNPFVVYTDKITESLLNRYGVNHPKKNPDIQRKSELTHYENHGVYNPSQRHISESAYKILEDHTAFKNACETYSLKELSKYLNVNESVIWNRHDRYELSIYDRKSRSQYEEEIARWLDNLNISYKRNVKFAGKTLDFLIGGLAIEFNGLYAHSEFSFYGKMLKMDKHYHFNKYKNCKNSNIKLLTIFEDEWIQKSHIIKNKILIFLNKGERGVPARKTSIKTIDYMEANCFLNEYHLQGTVTGAKFYGAYYQSQLIGVMSFNNRKDKEWELTRFCTDNKMHIGLFSKMLSYFIKEHNPIYLYSFSDNRWSWGEVYEKNNFEIEYEISPDYFVTDYHTRDHKFNWRKNRIAKRYNIDVSNNTELELTLQLKHDRIWDCGKIKWVYKLNTFKV